MAGESKDKPASDAERRRSKPKPTITLAEEEAPSAEFDEVVFKPDSYEKACQTIKKALLNPAHEITQFQSYKFEGIPDKLRLSPEVISYLQCAIKFKQNIKGFNCLKAVKKQDEKRFATKITAIKELALSPIDMEDQPENHFVLHMDTLKDFYEQLSMDRREMSRYIIDRDNSLTLYDYIESLKALLTKLSSVIAAIMKTDEFLAPDVMETDAEGTESDPIDQTSNSARNFDNDAQRDAQPFIIDLDTMVLETDKYEDKNYQEEQLGKKLIDGHANTQRQAHQRRLQSQFKGTTGTFIAVSRISETHTSQQMSDNVWLSLRNAGYKNDDFEVCDANSPYIALISCKNPQIMKQILEQKSHTHCRYLGNQGDTVQRGLLHFVDLRVNTENFVVTGSDTLTYEATKNAFEQTWRKEYPGIGIVIKQGRCIMRTVVDGAVVEEHRKTANMEVEITMQTDVQHKLQTGPIIIALPDGTQRALHVLSTAFKGTCVECGGSELGCKRMVDGELRWACKFTCYCCKAPLRVGHDENECLILRNTNPKAMGIIRRRNLTWLHDVQSFQRKPVNMTMPEDKRVSVDDDWQARALNNYTGQFKEVQSYANAAAMSKKSPNVRPYDVNGEKLAQGRAKYVKHAEEYYAKFARSPPPGVMLITVYDRLTEYLDGVEQVTFVPRQKEHPLTWEPPKPRRERPNKQDQASKGYRGTSGRVHPRDSTLVKTRANDVASAPVE